MLFLLGNVFSNRFGVLIDIYRGKMVYFGLSYINYNAHVHREKKNSSPSAIVWLTDVFLLFYSDGALLHRGIRYNRLQIHRQYMLVGSIHYLFQGIC